MDNYNAKFINQWNKFENAIGVTKVKSSSECIEQDERLKDKKYWHDCRMLRNLIHHNNDFAQITKSGYEQFVKMSEKIINPIKASKICIQKVYCAKNSSNLNEVLLKMKENDFSNVPIIDNEKHIIGVFSHYTLFLYVNNNSEVILEPQNLCIDEFKKYYLISANDETNYIFISKNESINNIIKIFNKNKNERKHLGALLVTANGNKNEPLYGIITKDDILEYYN